MKILFDHQTFRYRFGGIARYHYELAKGLTHLGQQADISTLISECEYLQHNDLFRVFNPLGQIKFKGRETYRRITNAINQFHSVQKIKKDNFDIFHPTYYNNYFFDYLNKPFVVTIHDMTLELFIREKNELLIQNKKLFIEKASLIIAISENTKQDIINYYETPPEKIEVVYHGYNPVKVPKSINTNGDYILYVGHRLEYKNFSNLIHAIQPILNTNRSLQLVCTGSSFSNSEWELFRQVGISDQVKSVSVSDDQLNTLYMNALLFVYPSVYEGFGMPILEAYANKCPICISNTSCFPEIAQDAAVYFDPYSIESMRVAINSVLKSSNLRNELTAKGEKRLKDFSWDKSSLETLKVYKQIV